VVLWVFRAGVRLVWALVFGSFSLVLSFGCGYLSGFWVGTSWVWSLGFKLGYLCMLSSVPRGPLRFF
jgi:hypothetical protein